MTDARCPYEPPRIDQRSEIAPVLIGFGSNVCATFTPPK
jgi:hypothetical protein